MPDVTLQYQPFASISYSRFGFARLALGYHIITGGDELGQETVYLVKGLYREKKADALFDGWTGFMDVVDTTIVDTSV